MALITAFLGLGSNLGDREDHIRTALGALDARGIRVQSVSPIYETEPWGVTEQPRFLNAACSVVTSLPPLALLEQLQEIEVALGRTPTVRYGPRPIDLDILLYGNLRINTPSLVIPHPGMLERSTVLVPLVNIAAGVVHPVTGMTMAVHRARLGPTPDVAPYPPGLGAPQRE